jgi:8-oxo-dGTP pyrophosphatase MutT (NUDIX family)
VTPTALHWPALAAARAHDARARVPFEIDGVVVGSVARMHLAALAAWPQDLRVDDAGVHLQVPAPARDQHLAAINAQLRARGLVRGWRDELFAIVNPHGGEPLARTERAAARFWGTLTLGAHANGYIAGADGTPTHLWIAQRAQSKATDPGLYDNLVGGGVPAGQTPPQTLVREGWEEAGLLPELMHTATPGRVLRLRRDITEGQQWEDLFGFDLAMPAGLTPSNQDGEVQGFVCLPVAEALALASSGSMTVDAALVTLDFALRHGLLRRSRAPHALPEASLARQLGTLVSPTEAVAAAIIRRH